MTVDEVKAARDRLRADLDRAVSPMVQEFEAKTGVMANIRTNHLEVTTAGDTRRRFLVTVHVDLEWEG